MCTGTCTLLTIVFGNICLWRFWLASYLQARLSASMFFDWTSHCFYKYRTLTTILISYSSQTITKIYWSTASSIFRMVTVLLLASLFLFGVINKSACWHTSPYIIMWRQGVISIPPQTATIIFLFVYLDDPTHIKCTWVWTKCGNTLHTHPVPHSKYCVYVHMHSVWKWWKCSYVPQSNQASIFSHM